MITVEGILTHDKRRRGAMAFPRHDNAYVIEANGASNVSSIAALNPKVSIIVPCYNVAPWISECLDSILANSYDNYEVLCVDDGSTDGTWELLDKYANNPHVRLFHQTNSGVSAARNVGIRAMSGDFVLFVDGDDTIDADCLTTLIEAVTDEPNPADVLVFRHRTLIEYPGKPPKFETHATTMLPCETKSQVRELLFNPLIGYSINDVREWAKTGSLPDYGELNGFVWCKLWRASMLREHDIQFQEDVTLKEDTMFALEYLLYARRVSCLDYVGYTYRIRADRSNTVSNYDADGRKTVASKAALLRARMGIHRKALDIDGRGCIQDFCGSIFLSSIEVCLLCAQTSGLGYEDFRQYCQAAQECMGYFDAPLGSAKAELCRRLLVKRHYLMMYIALKAASSVPCLINLARATQ